MVGVGREKRGRDGRERESKTEANTEECQIASYNPPLVVLHKYRWAALVIVTEDGMTCLRVALPLVLKIVPIEVVGTHCACVR